MSGWQHVQLTQACLSSASLQGYTAILPPQERGPVVCNAFGQVCTSATHVDSTSGTFPFPATHPCPILRFLGLEYTQWGFLCTSHSTIVHPNHLLRHIHRNDAHRPKGMAVPLKEKEKLLNHALTSHAIANSKIKFPLPFSPTESIPGLTPYLASRCPVQGCTTWRKVTNPAGRAGKYGSERWKKTWDHVNQKHGGKLVAKQYKETGVKLEERYILKPYFNSISQEDEESRFALVFDGGYTPPKASPNPEAIALPASQQTQLDSDNVDSRTASSLSISRPAAPIAADWLQKLGWGTWMQATGAVCDTLRALVEIPMRARVISSKGAYKTLEGGLLAVHELLEGYLQDANDYIESKHADLRTFIHSG